MTSTERHSLVGLGDLWEMKRKFQIEFLKGVGLKLHHYLLDIGCGTLRGGIPIIEYLLKGHYYGVECRKQVLAEGKKELLEHDLGDKESIFILTNGFYFMKRYYVKRTFDYIWAFSTLIHMNDKILDNCLRFVRIHLKPGGFFYANVNIGSKEEGTWEKFPVLWRSLGFYEETALRHGLHVDDIGSLKSLGHVSGSPDGDSQRMLRICH